MNKSYKQTKVGRAKAEEAAINRILCWIVGGTAVEFVVMLLDRYWVNYSIAELDLRVALDLPVKILSFAALLGAAALGYWIWRTVQAGKDPDLPATCCLVVLGISAACFAAWLFHGTGLALMRIGVLMVVVLAVLFYLYQREFFLIACQSALAILGVWMCSRGLGGAKAIFCYLYVILAALLVLSSVVLCRKLQQESGVFLWKEKKLRVFPKDANYLLLYAGATVSLVLLVCALLPLPIMALYAVAAAWILVMAVYYTVKLM